MVQSNRKIPTAALSALAAVVLVFVAAWIVIDRVDRRNRMRNQPDSLTVEASPLAVVGRPFELRVTLKDLAAAFALGSGRRSSRS